MHRFVLQLWPKEKPEADLFLARPALEVLDTTPHDVQVQIGALGIALYGNMVRLRPNDEGRLAAMFEVIEREITGKLDRSA